MEDLQNRLRAFTDVHTLIFDVRNREAVENAIANLPNDFKEVDILINDEIKVQAKVRKKLPSYIIPSEHVDIQIIKEDRGKMYVVQELNDWILGIKDELK